MPALVAFVAWAVVVSSLDAGGDYPGAFQGPGLAIDEVFNVEEGVRLVEVLPALAVGSITLKEAFGQRADLGPNAPYGYHNPDHPPLGRLGIGVAHHLTVRLFPPRLHPETSPFVTSAARTGSATALALLAFLVGLAATRWYGPVAGLVAAVAVVFMPRLFGHAHLAVLETFIALTYTAVALAVAQWWSGEKPPSWKAAATTGFVFGLALLTKIQAVFLPVPIAVWAVWRWRQQAIIPLIVWGSVGFIVFFVGWPWLWLDPVDHLRQFFGSATSRVSLNVWYFGTKYADRSVPWHYPLVMFLTTVPIGLQMLGLLGAATRADGQPAWKSPRELLLLGMMLFPLVMFSLPGVPVYDGTRLFAVVFPLWGLFIGRGAVVAWNWLQRRMSAKWASATLCILLALQGWGIATLRPCYLSYYNMLIGGLHGAERIDLEPTYWEDSFTREFLREVVAAVPKGSVVEVAPLLHQFQLEELLTQSPILRGHGIQLRPVAAPEFAGRRYVMFFRRKADLPAFLRDPPHDARLLAEVRRAGVQLAALYELP